MKKLVVLVFLCALLPAVAHARDAEPPTLLQKTQPYIHCFNDLSGSARRSKSRYLSWTTAAGPTGKESIVYGLYTLSDPLKCKDMIEEANKAEPHVAELESAGSAFMKSLLALTPLVQEAHDYYDQGDYKDDKMAKGKAYHPKLMAGWAEFEAADRRLSDVLETLEDKTQIEEIATIEKTEGKKARYHVLTVMMRAKALIRTETGANAPDLAKITESLGAFEMSVKDMEQYASANRDQIGSMFIGRAKDYLTAAKEFMRRVRDKTPLNPSEKFILEHMKDASLVQGSPQQALHAYNELVGSFNLGWHI